MVKQIGKHQPKNKKPLQFNSEGTHFAEMLAIAEDHPIWFRIILSMLFFNIPNKYIIQLMKRVV